MTYGIQNILNKMKKSEFEHYNLKRPLFNKDARKRFKRRAKLVNVQKDKENVDFYKNFKLDEDSII